MLWQAVENVNVRFISKCQTVAFQKQIFCEEELTPHFWPIDGLQYFKTHFTALALHKGSL